MRCYVFSTLIIAITQQQQHKNHPHTNSNCFVWVLNFNNESLLWVLQFFLRSVFCLLAGVTAKKKKLKVHMKQWNKWQIEISLSNHPNVWSQIQPAHTKRERDRWGRERVSFTLYTPKKNWITTLCNYYMKFYAQQKRKEIKIKQTKRNSFLTEIAHYISFKMIGWWILVECHCWILSEFNSLLFSAACVCVCVRMLARAYVLFARF